MAPDDYSRLLILFEGLYQSEFGHKNFNDVDFNLFYEMAQEYLPKMDGELDRRGSRSRMKETSAVLVIISHLLEEPFVQESTKGRLDEVVNKKIFGPTKYFSYGYSDIQKILPLISLIMDYVPVCKRMEAHLVLDLLEKTEINSENFNGVTSTLKRIADRHYQLDFSGWKKALSLIEKVSIASRELGREIRGYKKHSMAQILGEEYSVVDFLTEFHYMAIYEADSISFRNMRTGYIATILKEVSPEIHKVIFEDCLEGAEEISVSLSEMELIAKAYTLGFSKRNTSFSISYLYNQTYDREDEGESSAFHGFKLEVGKKVVDFMTQNFNILELRKEHLKI